MTSLTARTVERIAEIDPAVWDACAGPENPFVSHAFLVALERSGCVVPETGWGPCHIVLENERDEIVGAMPSYLKGHSYGEYVFDHGWADAYERAGGRYYPKLLVAVPFSPVPGPRLLVRREAGDDAALRGALLAAAMQIAERFGVSSLHVNFATAAEWELMGQSGMLQRTGEQFHWENRGYGSFEDFLNDLASRKRKAIRKERREALEPGIEIEILTGAALREAHWDAFFEFYVDTGSRKWGRPYLNREFFSRIGETMAERIALVMARRGGRYIAGALNLIGADTLYGRNWGAIEDHRFLHFEACYYQAIEFAIARGLKRVEAGAQGPHKLARGYLPVHTYSGHWIREPRFRDAVARYLAAERKEVDAEIDYFDEHSPFRRAPG